MVQKIVMSLEFLFWGEVESGGTFSVGDQHKTKLKTAWLFRLAREAFLKIATAARSFTLWYVRQDLLSYGS